MRLLVVGEAPGPHGGPPLRGRIGRRLAAWGGWPSEAAFAREVRRVNLLPTYPGRAAKGSRFDWVAASRNELKVLRRVKPGDVVLVLGARAAKALRLVPSWLVRQPFAVGAEAIVLPHPSGVNRWYNDPRNRGRVARCLTALHHDLAS